MIEKIREQFIKISKDYCDKTGYDYWESHIKYVVDIALYLADIYKADKEIVEISAIMHDISKPLEVRIEEKHNIVSADIASQKLQKLNYNDNKIKKIKECIINHNGKIDDKILSKEEWCVRNADILSLIKNISIFYYLAYKEYNFNYEDGRNFVKESIKNKMKLLDEKLYKKHKNIFEILLNSI